ncbi:MAG: hypothetical protein Q8922_12180 [Bacteroidota bacterium]|nr:hypothetical protein [Bacteroidota bacterium]MDP4233727.1 hypothetical protein [Bacteroidota bacterium]MDP4242366.1 hypothetical protein [Bacteroidota bacterium]MDP4288681.1 hypothetical protein [Bacteroidota bacterium]
MRVFKRMPQRSEEGFDYIQPLRALHSPLGVERIREFVLDRASTASFWFTIRAAFRGLFAEWVALGTIAICMVSAGIAPSTGSYPASNPTGRVPTGVAHASRGIPMVPMSCPVGGIAPTRKPRFVAVANQPTLIGEATIAAMTLPEESDSIIAAPPSEPACTKSPTCAALSSKINYREMPSTSLFARFDGGFLFKEFHMTTEGAELGMIDGWKMFAIEARLGTGHRDNRDSALHHLADGSVRLSETELQFGIQAGATTQLGNFVLSAMLGPSYWVTTSIILDPTAHTQSTIQSRRAGLSAEASIAYSLTTSLQAGVASLTSYRRPIDDRSSPFNAGLSAFISFSP